MTCTTPVLIKLFAYRFYKAHSGLLLLFFVTVLISFFFVNVLNQNHLTEEDRIMHNLALTLAFISSPTFTAFIFITWLAYMIKSWSFIATQLRLPEHLFLFYSFNAQFKKQRLTQWLAIQAIIAIPLMIYGLFALLIGIIYGHYALPLIILLYIAILITAGAAIGIQLDKRFTDHDTFPWTARITQHWPKPFFTLPLYHLVHRQKVTLLITKLLSISVLAAGVFLLRDNASDSRVAGIVALGIATTHAFITYRAHTFTTTYLTFSKNFPYSIAKRLYLTISTCIALVLAELIWLLIHHSLWDFTQAMLLIAGVLVLFQTLSHYTTPDIKKYLTCVFYVFITFFLLILFNLLPVLAPATLVTGATIFHIQQKRSRF